MRRVRTRRSTILDMSQAGDTIVEVLISIAVISLLLTGAFVVSRHSTSAVQDSQEHTAAEEQLRTQVERVRSALLSADANPSLPDPSTQTSVFCMPSTTTLVAIGNVNNPPASCKQGLYSVQVNRLGTSGDSANTYKFAVTWDKIGGGTGKESMYYRMYKSSFLDTSLVPTP